MITSLKCYQAGVGALERNGQSNSMLVYHLCLLDFWEYVHDMDINFWKKYVRHAMLIEADYLK